MILTLCMLLDLSVLALRLSGPTENQNNGLPVETMADFSKKDQNNDLPHESKADFSKAQQNSQYLQSFILKDYKGKVSFRKNAIVTLVCSDGWLPGAIALGSSLIVANSSHDLVALVSANVSSEARSDLANVFDHVMYEEAIASNRAIVRAPECVPLKLRLWQLPHQKALFVDADMITNRNMDDILHMNEISANADGGGWNAGLFVLAPSSSTFELLTKAVTQRFNGAAGDQFFLNHVFLPCGSTRRNLSHPCWGSQFGETYNKFARDLNVIEEHQQFTTLHYSGSWSRKNKPWMEDCLFKSDSLGRTNTFEMRTQLVCLWLNKYRAAARYLPKLPQTECELRNPSLLEKCPAES